MACLGSDVPILDLVVYSTAYLRHVDTVLRRISPEILRAVQTSSFSVRSEAGTMQRLHTILHVLAQCLSDKDHHLFLGNARRQLQDQDLIMKSPSNYATTSTGAQLSSTGTPSSPTAASATIGSSTEDQNRTTQLIFILLGLLTMFYDPAPDPEAGKLRMSPTGWPSKSTRRNTATWSIDSQDLSLIGPDVSFDDLLCGYSSHPGPLPVPKVQDQNNPSSEILRSEDVSFYILAKLLDVEIIWTNSICEHLEFSVRTKTLKLFRFPSFCVLLCLMEPDKTFLDGLFNHLLDSDTAASTGYMYEVLCTYRLLFGQHRDVRNLIKKICQQGKFWGFKSPFKKPHPSALIKEDSDPLLEDLCFKDCRKLPLFRELDVMDLKNVYVLDTDFPFFADRLAVLQLFVQNQLPQDWSVLWRDRRNVAKFWTVWAVVLFGVPSIILAVTQTILTGFQLRS